MDTIGDRLKAARESASRRTGQSVTQSDLGEVMGITQPSINRIESNLLKRGNVDVTRLMDAAKFLKVSFVWLATGNGRMEQNDDKLINPPCSPDGKNQTIQPLNQNANSINKMIIKGHIATIAYVPEIDLFHGEFIGLNERADFYARDIEGLRHEGRRSLNIFLDNCNDGNKISIHSLSGKIELEIDPDLRKAASEAAAATYRSLNQLINDALRRSLDLQFDQVTEPKHRTIEEFINDISWMDEL